MSSAQRPLYPFAAGANAVQQSSPSSRQTQDANPYSRDAQPQPFQRPGLPRPSPSPLARPYGQTNAQAAPSSSTNLLAPNDNRSVQATFARPPSAPKRFDGNLSLVRPLLSYLSLFYCHSHISLERNALSCRQCFARFSCLFSSIHL